jgi:hypothetical protein
MIHAKLWSGSAMLILAQPPLQPPRRLPRSSTTRANHGPVGSGFGTELRWWFKRWSGLPFSSSPAYPCAKPSTLPHAGRDLGGEAPCWDPPPPSIRAAFVGSGRALGVLSCKGEPCRGLADIEEAWGTARSRSIARRRTKSAVEPPLAVGSVAVVASNLGE